MIAAILYLHQIGVFKSEKSNSNLFLSAIRLGLFNRKLFFYAEITHRFQTARPEVRQLLLQYILPWLYNMELVDPNIPSPNSNSSFCQVRLILVRMKYPIYIITYFEKSSRLGLFMIRNLYLIRKCDRYFDGLLMVQ